MASEFFTIKELSAYLNVKTSTLYCMAERGELPSYKIGRLLRFSRPEIETWLKSRKNTLSGADKKATEIMKSLDAQGNGDIDINLIVRKAVEEVTGRKVYSSYRKARESRASEGRDA